MCQNHRREQGAREKRIVVVPGTRESYGRRVRQVTIHHLRVFLAVAHHRSFTRAAAEVGLTQAAVSAQVRDMSRILEAPLFEILGRKVALTQAARTSSRVLRRRQALRGDRRALRRAARRRGGPDPARRELLGGDLRSARLLATFEKSFPGVEITLEILNSALIEDRVVANEFDLGFVGHPPASADLEGEQFLEDEIFFAAARPIPWRAAQRCTRRRSSVSGSSCASRGRHPPDDGGTPPGPRPSSPRCCSSARPRR